GRAARRRGASGARRGGRVGGRRPRHVRARSVERDASLGRHGRSLDDPPRRTRPGTIDRMTAPQGGIFALGTASHAYLEFDVSSGREGGDLVAAISSLREPRTTMGGVNLVAGFRPELWRKAAPDAAPANLEGFNDDLIGIEGFVMPATQHDDKPADSHVASADQDRFGKIFRRNMPYGTVTNHGTMFVGFSSEQRPLAAMLESMAGLAGGVRDALTRYTRPLTGAYYFVPATDALRRVSDASALID